MIDSQYRVSNCLLNKNDDYYYDASVILILRMIGLNIKLHGIAKLTNDTARERLNVVDAQRHFAMTSLFIFSCIMFKHCVGFCGHVEYLFVSEPDDDKIIEQIFGSRPSDHYFRSVCLFVCLCRVFLSRL